MKFIKTKDGVYKVIDTYEVKYVIGYTEDGFEICVYKEDVIAEADTINKLCDGFYLDLGGEFDDTYLRRKDKFEFLKELAFDYMRKDIEVTLYAFIKTSKGLNYVAKMNNEGKLCLI